MNTVFLEFTKPFGPYASGDKAGFPEDAAVRYIDLGVAKRAGGNDGGGAQASAPAEAIAAAEEVPAAISDQSEPEVPKDAEQPGTDKPKASKGKTAK